MRFGVVILPEHRWSVSVARWRQAEEYGFDHGWTYDHIRWRGLAGGPWLGAIPTLTAAATATSRLRLGTLVANPRLRDPVAFAKDIMTIDDISGGRVICGIGSGGPDRDALRLTDLSAAQWATRFTEYVELTDLLLRQEPASYDGDYYRCDDLVLRPGCVQLPRVPIAVAGAGPRAMRLAARLADTWVSYGTPFDFEPKPYRRTVSAIRDQLDALEAACERVGRDPATIDRLVLTGASIGGVLDSAESFRDAAGVFAEIGVTDLVVHWPRPTPPYQGRPEVLDEIAGVLTAAEG